MYEDYFEKLRDECYLRNRTQNTADAYIRNIESFLKHTGKHPEELTLDDTRNYLIDKKKAKVAAATCNYYHSSLRFFYKFVLGKE